MASNDILRVEDSNDTAPPAAANPVRACSDTEKTRLAKLQTEYQESIGYVRPSDIKRNTAEWWEHLDYLEKGAIPFPGDGDNVKLPDREESCLSCIKYIRPCGSSVEDGKCDVCRGAGRVCRWLEPNTNIWTYPAHQRANKGTKQGIVNYWNTRDGKAEKAAPQAAGLWSEERRKLGKVKAKEQEGVNSGDELGEAEEEDASASLEPDYFGLSNARSQVAMREAAVVMLRDHLITADAAENTNSMFDVTSAALAELQDQADGASEDEPDDVAERRVVLTGRLERLVLHINRMIEHGGLMPAEKLVTLASM